MALINENMMEMLAVSKELLTSCVENETLICVHLHKADNVTSGSTFLNEFVLETNELYLEGKHFMSHLHEEISNIQYIDFENSIYIVMGDTEIYIDILD